MLVFILNIYIELSTGTYRRFHTRTMLTIQLDSDKTHTAQEIIEIVVLSLDFVGERSTQNYLQYSSSDVYWVLRNLLDYINRRMEGEFVLKRLKKGAWGIEYIARDIAKRKAEEKHKKELRRTADYIQQITNHRPAWG